MQRRHVSAAPCGGALAAFTSQRPRQQLARQRPALVRAAAGNDDAKAAMEAAMQNPAVAAQVKQMEEAMKNPAMAGQMQQMMSAMQNPQLMARLQELRVSCRPAAAAADADADAPPAARTHTPAPLTPCPLRPAPSRRRTPS